MFILISVTVLALIFGAILGFASIKLKVEADPNASEFERDLLASLDSISKLVLDFSDLYYISSAGLRVLLKALKQMKQQEGTVIVRNLSPVVEEVFRMTGLDQILTVEKR